MFALEFGWGLILIRSPAFLPVSRASEFWGHHRPDTPCLWQEQGDHKGVLSRKNNASPSPHFSRPQRGLEDRRKPNEPGVVWGEV